MGWSIHTSFGKIRIKTRLSFLFTPLIDREAPPQISGDFASAIEKNDGTRIKCKVFLVDQSNAIIELEDRTRWRMTPAVGADYLGILEPMRFGGYPVPEWVIRETA